MEGDGWRRAVGDDTDTATFIAIPRQRAPETPVEPRYAEPDVTRSSRRGTTLRIALIGALAALLLAPPAALAYTTVRDELAPAAAGQGLAGGAGRGAGGRTNPAADRNGA